MNEQIVVTRGSEVDYIRSLRQKIASHLEAIEAEEKRQAFLKF